MEYPKEIIKEVAQLIDMGMDCYLNIDTMEIESLFGDSYMAFADSETEKLQNEITTKVMSWSNVIRIKPPSSREAFKFMEGFIDECIPDNTRLKIYLLESIEKRKPFQKFNHIIHQSEYRQQWFDYKSKQLQLHVIEELEYASPKKYLPEDFEFGNW